MLLSQVDFYSFPFAALPRILPLLLPGLGSDQCLNALQRRDCLEFLQLCLITPSCVVALSPISRTRSVIRFWELEDLSVVGCCDQRGWRMSVSLMRSYQAELHVNAVRRASSDLPVALF